ncbi:hypothetical protein CH249_15135 [Rhodococcus sp. 05-2255-3B1]|jgi:hypothetical protein|uniref:hypothetical protein n=1 Tax=unclassified Rhodococcus (in: high G+C Gram-positive bacteria) TaxID=192944 RepID=UPI000B9A27FB|nr:MULTISPECIES: hypothetical protein [unclassified Rhodococcus (in: high G+C Gram-positive bacteria)]OZE03129.1 hypothetical protein CH250_23200 [Rhodococcus sp. 05-2255-3C]OZE09519.1 hypothetical protein CH249_15135 [Rhodococcus sp. 05-2255-3B1]OZE14785.1 hypothetical protein CH255_21480 [Rhodococcus sp. 05-2255-2A2]
MTLLDMLPSLGAAYVSRCDPTLWPADTHCVCGRITVDGVALEDLADAQGTPVQWGSILVTRVRSVIAGEVGVDAEFADLRQAVVVNRHSVGPVVKVDVHGPGRRCVGPVELPADLRAGDVLALVTSQVHGGACGRSAGSTPVS